jgi:hypothetical protein
VCGCQNEQKPGSILQWNIYRLANHLSDIFPGLFIRELSVGYMQAKEKKTMKSQNKMQQMKKKLVHQL